MSDNDGPYSDEAGENSPWNPPKGAMTGEEKIDHPKHYNSLGAQCSKCGHPIECIDVTRHMSFNLGNVVKYCWRESFKNGIEDLRKGAWYLADEIKKRTPSPIEQAKNAWKDWTKEDRATELAAAAPKSAIAEAWDKSEDLVAKALGVPGKNGGRRAALIWFHQAMRQPIPSTPQVPSDDRVRLRARLMAEEFVETLRAMFQKGHWALAQLEETLTLIDEKVPVEVDLPALADGLADQKVVLEGTDLEFGLPGNELFAEVMRANMAKVGGGFREDGKVQKPKGWVGPDIEGVLRRAGWKP
jgi:predicted HAD superfamily Cof-like phosphohydrolase